MSVTVQFAFNAPGSLAALQATVGGAIGVPLRPYEGDAEDLFCKFLGLELSLWANHLEDDRELDFSRYGFVLSTRTAAPNAARRLYQVEATALVALSLLLAGVVGEGLLSYEVQILLARYTVDRDVIYDAVSAKAVQLPQHLVDLRTRMAR